MEISNTLLRFYEGMKPVPRISVAEWADRYRYLSPLASAEPGRYRTDRTPYLRRIMECLSAHEPYKKVVFMKSAQVGATESGTNFIGYVMHISPAPIMVVLPTEEMVKKLSKGRVDPLVQMCPEVRARVAENKSRDGNNTILQKNFDGGVLFFAGANSGAGLRSVPIRFLILDEVDAYPQDLDGEGSPIELAIARTRTFPNKKIYIVSTPTISDISFIEKEFICTDQNYYHVPCPHCGGMQRLVFSQLRWDDGKPDTAQYECIHCGRMIAERHKVEMLAAGEWIPEKPENSNLETIGFHINSLYSPLGWHSWAEVAADFIKAKDNPTKLKVFVNTELGETWTERGEAPAWKNLYNRRENYRINSVNRDVCFITSGVDVQRDRLELEIVGWCADKRSYSIDYRVIEGDTAQNGVWLQLAEVVKERWVRDDGVELPMRLMCVDSGYNTTHVYEFCRKFDTSRVIPTKGQDQQAIAVRPGKQVDITKAGKRVGKLKPWNIAVSMLKSELYSDLRLEKDGDDIPPSGYCHFPEYDEKYFRGLTAEELTTRYVRGFAKEAWVKRYERNEPLDCRIYARAAATILGLYRLSKEKIMAMGGVTAEKKRQPLSKKIKKSSFWD